jgi:uncharacterized phage protein (TIGR01671 family)
VWSVREIKFREWDKHREEIYGKGHGMSYGEREDFDDMVGWRFAHEENFGEEPRVLMQFTGLKDKNGREIYEGDIVNVVVRGGYRSGFEQFIKSVPVTYNEKIACFDPFGWCVMWCKDEKVISAEVIGNIHENPDLLKEG